MAVVIARSLGPEGMGRIVYLIWIAETASLVVNLGLQNSLTRYLASLIGQGRIRECRGLTAWLYVRYLLLAVAGAGVVGLGARKLAVSGASETVCFLLALCILSKGLGTIYHAYLAGSQRFEISARINMLSSAGMVAGTMIGIGVLGQAGALVGYTAGSVLPALWSFSLLRNISTAVWPDAPLRRRLWKYSLQTWLAAIVSAFVWSRMEILYIEHYWSDREVAMFAAGLTLAAMVSQVATLFSGAFLAHLSQLCGMQDRKAIQRTYATGTRLMMLLVFPISFGGAAVMPDLLPRLYGPEFVAAVPNAAVLLIASFTSFAFVGSALVYAMERSGFIAITSFLGAVTSVVACVLIVPRYGAWGAVWTRSAIQFSMIALGIWYITRRMRYSFPFGALGRTLISAVLSAATAWLVVNLCDTEIALPLAIPASVGVYALAIRTLRLVNAADVKSLQGILGRLPLGLRTPATSFLEWVAAKA